MKRFFLVSFAMLLCTLSVGLFAPSSASAASIYDDVVQLSPTLQIYDSFAQIPSDSHDFSTDWHQQTIAALQKRVDQNNGNSSSAQAAIDELNQLISDPNGNWAVLTGEIPSTYFTIVYSFDEFALAEFFTYQNQDKVLELNGALKMITVNYDPNSAYPSHLSSDDGTIVTNLPWVSNVSQYVLSSEFTPNRPKIFLSTFPVIYPPGYEGLQIPDSYSPPEPPSTEIPDWYVLESKDWHIKVRDSNFNTFDPPAFLCDDELAPILNYTVFSGKHESGGTVLSSGVISPTVLIEFDVPHEPGWYTITGQYECGDNSPAFSEIGFLEIEMAANGSHINQIFEDCVTTEFPYVNFVGCYNNVMIFANMLAFNQLNFGTDFTPPDGCRNLVVLGSWIGASTNTVCPMVPEYIRNVVTPFVTFLLGLLMLKFITQSTGGGFN